MKQIVQTFEFEGAPRHVQLETATFEAVEDKTKLTIKAVSQTVEARDAEIESGREEGTVETYDRFAELLAGRNK